MAPPKVEDLILDLETAEVDIMDIIAPQHKRLRAEKRAKLFNEIKQEEPETETEDKEDDPIKVVVVK